MANDQIAAGGRGKGKCKCGKITGFFSITEQVFVCMDCLWDMGTVEKYNATTDTDDAYEFHKNIRSKNQSQEETVAKTATKTKSKAKAKATGKKNGMVRKENQVEMTCTKCGKTFTNSKFTKYITKCKECR